MILVTDPQQFDIIKDSLLIVEGTDDRRFVGAFLKWLGIANIQMVAVGGTPGFRPFLTNTLINAPNFRRLRSLGIVRDADESAASAFQSIRDSLKDASLPVPSKPYMPAQLQQFTVSVAILPDGEEHGELEDLCLRSLQGQPAIECIEQYIDCLANVGMACKDPIKSKVHAFLAGGEKPELRLGEASEAGAWDWNSSAFSQLAQFLQGL